MNRLSLLLLALLLPACQLRPPVALPDTVADMERWTLTGRLGYRSGNEGGSASIDWYQRGEQGELRFAGPVGIGSARLYWAPGEAELNTGKEQLRASSSAELAWRLTGLWLPVEALQYWVRGLPWPEAPAHAEHDDQGRLLALQQLGWSLDFSGYPETGLPLPARIRASHQDQRFTLVIRAWEGLR